MKSLILILTAALGMVSAQTAKLPTAGKRYPRLVVRNAMVVEGVGTPAAGPKDIVIENDRITDIVSSDSRRRPGSDYEIDAAGRYVMPGLINLHGHIQDERAGQAMPVDYCLKLWLACGITTVRDVGSNFEESKKLRAGSKDGSVVAPRLFLYPFFGKVRDEATAKARVRELKANGADGIKAISIDRISMKGLMEEANAQGMRVAHHVGVEEVNAWDNIKFHTTSIEHWYGIPDAAIPDGVQSFPASYNYANEVDRFRYAGRLWREASPERLAKVLDGMVAAGVAWDPTLNIYEASRDLQRAMTSPWFKEFLHPSLEKFFLPNPANHGSYFFGWSSTDEAFWKENYRIWMAAVKDFERRGGLIGTGEDAGFIWQVYGFGLLRELELHQEAGFHPLKVIQHATYNGARILGQESWMGRVRQGFAADMLIVNGNPLENLKVLSPMGVEEARDGKLVRGGGIEWTIKDGIPYHVPELVKDIKEMVRQGRNQKPSRTSE